ERAGLGRRQGDAFLRDPGDPGDADRERREELLCLGPGRDNARRAAAGRLRRGDASRFWKTPSAPTSKPYMSVHGNEIRTRGRTAMPDRVSLASIAFVATLCAAGTSAWSQEGAKFPDWKGQWVRIGAGGQYDPTKPAVRGQQPPLTPEYQAIWEANI